MSASKWTRCVYVRGTGLQASWFSGICRPSYAPHICHLSFQWRNWSSVNFTVVPVHLNGAKLLAAAARTVQLSFMVSGIYSACRMLWFRSFGFKEATLVVTGLLARWTELRPPRANLGLFVFYFFLISEWVFFSPKFWFDVTYDKSTVEIPVWSSSVALTLNPSDYKGRYSLSKLQKTDGGNEKTTHTPMRGREVYVDTRWMRGISYLERSSVSSGPSHQDWTLLKACSLASESQKQLHKKTTQKATQYMY